MIRRTFFQAVAAGIFIGIGGTVLLSVENRTVGAILFSVALLSICTLGLYLFTGKVGYLAHAHKKADFAALATGLLGNAVGCFVSACGVRLCRPELSETARTMVEAKLEKGVAAVLAAGIFCGILMFTAVHIYREKQLTAGIFFCVPVFILAGFEHSIADMFYFFCAGVYSWKMILFLLTVVIGNSIGGVLTPLLLRCAEMTPQKDKSNTHKTEV